MAWDKDKVLKKEAQFNRDYPECTFEVRAEARRHIGF